MRIALKKFGTTLNSRQFGRESFAAFKPSLANIKKSEEIIVDFAGVVTLTPSWADEFLGSLVREFKRPILLKNTKNPSVQASLKLLKDIYRDKLLIE